MKTVFFDIDTQLDFVSPAGALYVPGAETLIPRIAELNRRGAETGVVISTTDAHAESDPEFRDWPPHCVAGTLGQRKPEELLRPDRIVVPTSPGSYDCAGARQVILEKQQLDCFTNPNLAALLERLNADRYVVYGVVTEYCVRCASMGLLKTGKPVTLVTDAIQTLSPEAGHRTIDAFVQAGGLLAACASLES